MKIFLAVFFISVSIKALSMPAIQGDYKCKSAKGKEGKIHFFWSQDSQGPYLSFDKSDIDTVAAFYLLNLRCENTPFVSAHGDIQFLEIRPFCDHRSIGFDLYQDLGQEIRDHLRLELTDDTHLTVFFKRKKNGFFGWFTDEKDRLDCELLSHGTAASKHF